jgi:hypothetical protein
MGFQKARIGNNAGVFWDQEKIEQLAEHWMLG